MKTHDCPTCGKRFVLSAMQIHKQATGRPVYCSRPCAGRANGGKSIRNRKSAKRVPKVCERCGSVFPGMAHQKYCGADCRKLVRAMRYVSAPQSVATEVSAELRAVIVCYLQHGAPRRGVAEKFGISRGIVYGISQKIADIRRPSAPWSRLKLEIEQMRHVYGDRNFS